MYLKSVQNVFRFHYAHQIIGSERSYGKHKTPSIAPREITMWIGVKHQEKKALELFTREIAPAGTGMGKVYTATWNI